MKIPKPLHYELLRKKIHATDLPFKTTNDIKILTQFLGQKRAIEALIFGIEIESHGYNLYAMGPSGIGKRFLINSILSEKAKKQPVPSDWCYIHNFNTPEKPIALELPAGLGQIFQQDMKLFINEMCHSVITFFESNEYQSGKKRIKISYNKKIKSIHEDLDSVEKIPQLYKEQYKKEKEFESLSIVSIIKPLISRLKKKYRKYKKILNYLLCMKMDIVNHIHDFIKQDERTNLFNFSIDHASLINYKVNLIVNNSQRIGAPIIFDENPSYASLICHVEHVSQMESLSTNLTLIKSGNLHLANGGYLVVDARKLKKNHEAWEALKRALYAGRIIIKPIESESESVKSLSLEPTPIPLNVKVILIGDRNTYYSLCQRDPDFLELFKVAVDFDEQIDRNKKNIQLYAKLIGTIVQRKKLSPFHSSAVAEIIDYSSRLAEDVKKLSTHIRSIKNLIIEADYWSKRNAKKIVDAKDVKYAIHAQIHRMDRARDIYYQDIHRKFIAINTSGQSIGQVNCLSVRRVGSFSYGHPTRVTARVRLGEGKIIDIQREIKLAGPLHSKATFIILSYLSSYFSKNQPFSLSASLAFEQVYCWTDGDSASVGELCALLSALAEIPINQFLAVTGSVDQHGNVQAIGGVNEKIEGFYDVCKEKGLTGNQGVLIPSVNAKNLMLREDILEAAKTKTFFIYSINHIDEAIYLLTGLNPGKRNKDGNFSRNTIYYKIENRLQQFSKNRLRITTK
ncbi:MAG: AAA family ATPase [Gammaproteobacteria bacterium]|nr:AAA family ATPase [Gammaproteobacteria bacterium]